jgi:hypothetical protein
VKSETEKANERTLDLENIQMSIKDEDEDNEYEKCEECMFKSGDDANYTYLPKMF